MDRPVVANLYISWELGISAEPTEIKILGNGVRLCDPTTTMAALWERRHNEAHSSSLGEYYTRREITFSNNVGFCHKFSRPPGILGATIRFVYFKYTIFVPLNLAAFSALEIHSNELF